MANARTVKSFALVTVFSVAARFVSFLFKVYVSRAYGAEVVGLYQISLSVLQLLFAFVAGAPTVLSRKVAAAVDIGDNKRASALTTASLVLGASASVAVCVLCYALNYKLGFLFSDERAVLIFLIMLPSLFTSTVYSSLRSWFWGRKSFLTFSSTELFDEACKLLLCIIFASLVAEGLSGAKGVAWAFTVADISCVVLLAVLYFKAGGRLAKPQGVKEILSATIPLSSMRIVTSLIASFTALMLPQRLVSAGMSVAQATAEYGRVAGMALPLIMAPITVVAALSVVLTPDMATAAARNDNKSLTNYLETLLVFASLVAAVFFAVYVPLGEQLGKLFFNDETAGKFVEVCAVLVFPMSLYQVTAPVLNAIGLEKKCFANYVCGAAILIPCIIFLPRYVGVYAMAIGSLVCFGIGAALHLRVLKKHLGKIGGVKKSLGVCAFSLPLALLGTLLKRLLLPYLEFWAIILVVGALVCALYAAFVLIFKTVNVRSYLVLFKRKGARANAARESV